MRFVCSFFHQPVLPGCFKTTSRCSKHQRVVTPRCPKHQRVATPNSRLPIWNVEEFLRDFLFPFSFTNLLLLVPLEMSYTGPFTFFSAFWLSYKHLKTTLPCPYALGSHACEKPKYSGESYAPESCYFRCPKHRRVETPNLQLRSKMWKNF